MKDRFRKYLPIVVDIETSGINPEQHAILEISASIIKMDEQSKLIVGENYSYQVSPFENAKIDKEAIEFNGINPFERENMISEEHALRDLFKHLKIAQKESQCTRCILVAHNASFDHGFLKAAVKRSNLKNKNPFHPFSSFDTATLAAAVVGETVLRKAIKKCNIEFDDTKAHSAKYDTEKTAELFCHLINHINFIPNPE